MRCHTVQSRLDAYAAGSLTDRARRRVASHLAGCARCRAAWHRRERVAEMLRSSSVPDAPPGFADRVVAAARNRQHSNVETQTSPLEAWRRSWGQWTWPTRFAVAAGLALGLILGAAMGVTAPGSPTGDGQSAAAPDTASDPTAAYQFDMLSGSPEGSLAQTYLTAGTDDQERNGS